MNSEMLAAASQALGVPKAIVQRSAQARANAGGVSLDEVLSAWSGGATLTPAAPPPASERVPEPAPTVEAVDQPPAPPPPRGLPFRPWRHPRWRSSRHQHRKGHRYWREGRKASLPCWTERSACFWLPPCSPLSSPPSMPQIGRA